MMPWTLDSSQIMVLGGFSGKIIGEERNDFLVEFYDDALVVMEARIAKREFVGHPIVPTIGMYFGLVIFQRVDQSRFEVRPWPIMDYWHLSLRG